MHKRYIELLFEHGNKKTLIAKIMRKEDWGELLYSHIISHEVKLKERLKRDKD
jgi:hypothetical protein